MVYQSLHIGFIIQILPFVEIFFGIFFCFEFIFEFIKGQGSIYIFSSTLDLIVVLWSLKYIMRLRQYALNKIIG